MKSARINMLIAYLSELNEKGVTHTPSPEFDDAMAAALTELDVPFRRTVYGSGYIIELKED